MSKQPAAERRSHRTYNHACNCVHCEMVATVDGGDRNQSRVNEYAAIEPRALSEDMLQREGRREGAGNMRAWKNAGVDSIAAEYPVIEPPQ